MMPFSVEKCAGYERTMNELVAAQLTLFAYICVLTANSPDARDILQETNLKICKNAAKYDPTRPFIKWAKTLAFYEVKAHRTKQQRDRLVFEDDVFAIASEQAEETSEALEIERNFKVLEGCVEKLPATLRAVVEARYREGGSLNTVAQLSNRSTNAVKLLLIRARRALSDCVRLASAEEVEA